MATYWVYGESRCINQWERPTHNLANRKVLLALQFLDDVADLEGGAQLEAQVFHHHVGGEKEQGLSCTTENKA
jgi:hypothetical protein